MRRAAFLLLCVSLAGCGLREPLEPPPGQPMPAASAMSRQAPTTEEMLTPPPIARPERVTELLSRSEERRDDRFDLPPGEIPPGGNPVRDERSDDSAPSEDEAPE
jgi:predicted small lipoprotein YifL